MKFNRTKIIATLGPKSANKTTIKKMAEAGCSVFRINASHGNHQLQLEAITLVRTVSNDLKINLAILYDLQGPKIRIGDLPEEGVLLSEGQPFMLTSEFCVGDSTKAFISYDKFTHDIKPHERILIDDGKIELLVNKIEGNTVHTTVTDGGLLTSRKGVNLPGTLVSIPSLTPKDLDDLSFAIEHEIDWIGLSFVRHPDDVKKLKLKIKDAGMNCAVIAKIEKPQALEHIDAIIEAADGIMVARGDLGVEVPLEQVPVVQKTIVRKCIMASKPVIIATQMMENMIHEQFPTRAEVTDVANAVIDGADAVMLSAETSVGRDPVNVVKTMWRIVQTAQESGMGYRQPTLTEKASKTIIRDSILFTASQLAGQCKAKAIVTMTYSGYSALKMAAMRPQADIVVFTGNKRLLNRLSIVWGTRTYFYDRYDDTDTNIDEVKQKLKTDGIVKSGDLIVHTYSTPLHLRGTANTIKISEID